MATTFSSSPNTKPWWPRITAGKLDDDDSLFPVNIARRPKTSSGLSRPAWMIPVMNLSSTSSFSSNKSSGSRFNFAAVFGSKSKRRHPVDIQDPPSQIRSLPVDTHSAFADSSHRLSRAVTFASGASTDAPLTPSDPPPSFGAHIALPLTDLTDPFVSTSPLADHRSSTHSDKSLSKRLMHKIDGKTTKSTARLPVGDGTKRRESRDRSSTLPSRAKIHPSETYQALRAVEPPWASDTATVRQSKSTKPTLPWPPHQRTYSSSSVSDETEKPTRTHSKRPSTSSSIPPTPSRHADTFPLLMPLPASRANPRPPPTSDLPPTPTPGPRSPTPPSSDLHALRSRSGTDASTSAVSFASSLSSLSFNSRPSPLEPSSAHDYPSLMSETLPVPGHDDVIPRRSSNSGSSSRSYRDDKPSKSALPVSRHVQTPSVSSSAASSRRERVLSPTPEASRTVRKQRSFHNTSLNAPTPTQPTLRHYNSFDPPSPPHSSGHGQVRAPPPPPLRSPPLPPSQDLPPLPSSAVSITKRGSTGKDSMTSPRRRLFGVNRHDRDRERKQELDNVDTNVTPISATSSGQIPTSSSSTWFDDRGGGGAGSEPASASSTSTSIAQDVAQHIVPPAELLRLGAEWERESLQGRNGSGLRRAKSSWAGTQGTRGTRSGEGATGGAGAAAAASGSKLPRSASLLSKATSAPSFSRADEEEEELPVGAGASSSGGRSGGGKGGGGGGGGGSRSVDGHNTSLSPPPPRRSQQRTQVVRAQASVGGASTTTGLLPLPPPRRTPTASSLPSLSPPKGALIERKPSFLDMSSRQSVTLDVPPQLGDRDRNSDELLLERDSFLELSSRDMGSIETIRESISSVDSFME